MKIAIFVLTGILTAGFQAQTAFAQSAGAQRVTTKERVMKRAESQFDRYDTDKDGTIEKPEYDKVTEEAVTKLRERMNKRFEEADTNKDGKISREEFIAARSKWFSEVDTNSDGIIDRSEMNTYNRKRRSGGE